MRHRQLYSTKEIICAPVVSYIIDEICDQRPFTIDLYIYMSMCCVQNVDPDNPWIVRTNRKSALCADNRWIVPGPRQRPAREKRGL